MNRLSDILKIDTALTPASLDGAGTGEYHPVGDTRKSLFAVLVGAMATAATSVIQVMQAQDAAATGAKVVTGAAATITADTDVAAAKLTAAAATTADTFVLNGLTFTGAAAADYPNRVFLADNGDNDATAASIVLAINNSSTGVPNVSASASSAVVTVVADPIGKEDITVVGTATRLVSATLRAVGYVEVDASAVDKDNGFDHLAVRVTNSAAILTSATLIRGDSRYTPTQKVAASDA